MRKKRAMTSKVASEKKIAGHLNETHFASLIDGEVNKGDPKTKKDVIDKQHRSHSVKGGDWWQGFLYKRSRFEENTIFQGLGEIASIAIRCLDVFPDSREEYQKRKPEVKFGLQAPMRDLFKELKKKKILKAVLEKSLFEGGEVNYLSCYIGQAKDQVEDKIFHVFHKDDLINSLMQYIYPENSKARSRKQTDDLKVVFKSRLHKNSNMAEIEVRTDKSHYRTLRFRLNAKKTFEIAKNDLGDGKRLVPQVLFYGKASKTFKPQS